MNATFPERAGWSEGRIDGAAAWRVWWEARGGPMVLPVGAKLLGPADRERAAEEMRQAFVSRGWAVSQDQCYAALFRGLELFPEKPR